MDKADTADSDAETCYLRDLSLYGSKVSIFIAHNSNSALNADRRTAAFDLDEPRGARGVSAAWSAAMYGASGFTNLDVGSGISRGYVFKLDISQNF